MSTTNMHQSKSRLALRHRICLKSKLEMIKIFYNDALEAFKNKLDSVTDKVVQEASDSLCTSDDEFLRLVPDILDAVECCNNELIEIHLLLCEKKLQSFAIGDCSEKVVEECHKTDCSRLCLGSSQENDACSSETSTLLATDPESAVETKENLLCHQESTSIQLKRDAELENVISSPVSTCCRSTETVSDTGNLLDSLEEESEGVEGQRVKMPTCENGFASPISFSYSKHVEVVVSDVSSPGLFCVQLEEWQDALLNLQHEVNDFYSEIWTQRLQLSQPPPVGTVCIALYPLDKRWYRAKINKTFQNDLCEVLYIDYGNTSVLAVSNLREALPRFLDLPALSISCKLHGVRPCHPSKNWTVVTNTWFNEYVFGKTFVAKFDSIHASQAKGCVPVVDTILFAKTESKQDDMLWSVAQSLVYLGFAAFAEKWDLSVEPTIDHQETEKKQSKGKKAEDQLNALTSSCENAVALLSTLASPVTSSVALDVSQQDALPPLRTSEVTLPSALTPSCANDVAQSESCRMIPAGAEYSYHQTMARFLSSPAQSHRDEVALVRQANDQPVGYMNFLERQSNHGCQIRDRRNAVESCSQDGDEAPGKWNPMRDDYVSPRNNYSTDVDNSCVAVENLDCESWMVCKFFRRGDCWKGENCHFSHIRDPSTLYECKVLAYQTLASIALTPGHVAIMRCMYKPNCELPNQFYVQVICAASDSDQLLRAQSLAPDGLLSDLNLLTEDMKRHYSSNRKRFSSVVQASLGEMYCVVVDKVFCRVTITQKARSGQRVKVFLVDYGFSFWKDVTSLLPFAQAFMHLPAQALLVANDSALLAVPTHVYVARIKHTVCSDAPLQVTLLHEIESFPRSGVSETNQT